MVHSNNTLLVSVARMYHLTTCSHTPHTHTTITVVCTWLSHAHIPIYHHDHHRYSYFIQKQKLRNTQGILIGLQWGNSYDTSAPGEFCKLTHIFLIIDRNKFHFMCSTKVVISLPCGHQPGRQSRTREGGVQFIHNAVSQCTAGPTRQGRDENSQQVTASIMWQQNVQLLCKFSSSLRLLLPYSSTVSYALFQSIKNSN